MIDEKTSPALQEAAGRIARTTKIDCWVSLNNFVSFWYRKFNIKMWGLDSGRSVVTLHRVAKFRVKGINSDNQRIRRGL